LALIALITKRHLGRDYIVLDRAAKIKFLKQGRGIVRAVFSLEGQYIDSADGRKHLIKLIAHILDSRNKSVAQGDKHCKCEKTER